MATLIDPTRSTSHSLECRLGPKPPTQNLQGHPWRVLTRMNCLMSRQHWSLIVTCHTGLSHRTFFGKITSEGRRPGASRRPRVRTNVRVGRPSADGPWQTAQADGRLADGPGGRPVLRQSAQPPYRKIARNIITFFNFFSPLQGSPSSIVAPRVIPQSYFLL
jgi:hypothetical protein